jgi:hypothetical protein
VETAAGSAGWLTRAFALACPVLPAEVSHLAMIRAESSTEIRRSREGTRGEATIPTIAADLDNHLRALLEFDCCPYRVALMDSFPEQSIAIYDVFFEPPMPPFPCLLCAPMTKVETASPVPLRSRVAIVRSVAPVCYIHRAPAMTVGLRMLSYAPPQFACRQHSTSLLRPCDQIFFRPDACQITLNATDSQGDCPAPDRS